MEKTAHLKTAQNTDSMPLHMGNNRGCTYLMVAALTLVAGAGCKRPPPGAESPATTAAPTERPPATAAPAPVAKDAPIRVNVNANGYEPASVSAPVGKPLTLIFRRTSDDGCGEQLVFPQHNIKKQLPLNEDVVVTITPQDTQEIQFTC